MYPPGLPNPFLAVQCCEPKSLGFKTSILILDLSLEYKSLQNFPGLWIWMQGDNFCYHLNLRDYPGRCLSTSPMSMQNTPLRFVFSLDLFNLVKSIMSFPIITVIVSWIVNADPRNSACSDGFREAVTSKTQCLPWSCFQSSGWGSLVQVQSQTQMITRQLITQTVILLRIKGSTI